MNSGGVRLYEKLKKKNYLPKNICEVGVFVPEDSNLSLFIQEGIKTTLIEADPICVSQIYDFFGNRNNVKVIEAAVFDFHGQVELSRKGSSTFISSLEASPALVNDKYQINEADQFTAKSITFDEIDSGDFDLLSIDIEGAEWFVIKHMKSRPNVISIETHGKYYVNPHIDSIKKWLLDNSYVAWYLDQSDTVYVKMGTFNVDISDRIAMIIKRMKIFTIKQKRILKKITGAK